MEVGRISPNSFDVEFFCQGESMGKGDRASLLVNMPSCPGEDRDDDLDQDIAGSHKETYHPSGPALLLLHSLPPGS